MKAPLPTLIGLFVCSGLLGTGASAAATASGRAGDQGALPPTRIEQTDPAKALSKLFDEPLSGTVVNRTVTVLGRDFYQSFALRWRTRDLSSHVSLTVFERPTARLGSELWITYRQKKVFHLFMPPARAAVRTVSSQAVDVVYEAIATSAVERTFMRSPDLATEEF